jgi:hypothetical protein
MVQALSFLMFFRLSLSYSISPLKPNPTRIGNYNDTDTGNYRAIALSRDGNLAFIVDSGITYGLHVLNVTNPKLPTRIGNYNDSQTYKYIDISLSSNDNLAFIIDKEPGMGSISWILPIPNHLYGLGITMTRKQRHIYR